MRVRELSPERRQAMGTAGRRYAQTHATYPRLAEAFIVALQNAGANRDN